MATTMEVAHDKFIERAKELGHQLKLDEDGDVDRFALDIDNHNGPMCVLCGEMWCFHCTGADKLKPCESGPVVVAVKQ